MIYLYWYLGIGVAVLAVVFSAHRLTKKDEPESLRDLLDAVNPDRKKLSYRILNSLVVPVLAAIAVVVAWPAALYLKGKEILGKKSLSALNAERQFAVERSHLQERLTALQIETREVVTDPLGAVPDLPFGHLNAAWKAFVEAVGADDELWSFTAPWQTKWGRKESRTGYVVVRGGVPASHFLTMWTEIEDEPESDQGAMPPRAGAVYGASADMARR
ncbi:MAG: hypothetical protein IT530_00220 [Burkholderiales bacterium]|nr:hypothetical protein [Burkholderiales bacterium]